MNRFNGKVAVVTGGSSGIGLAAADQLVREGAKVFISGRSQTELEKAVKLLGDNAIGVQGDVSRMNDLDELFKTVKRFEKQIDILVVNAAVGEWATLETITEDHYNKTFDINVKGTLFTVQKALPLLKDGASIILIGSIMASKGIPAFSVYSASKAAVRSFVRSWIFDLKERNIRVNVLSPGATETPGFLTLGGNKDREKTEQYKDMVASRIPRGKLGTVNEVAKAIVFLASEDSSYINGSEILIDGGVSQI
ncbi:SDR family NAD(P)-dependent oxidoreductase [Bacillus coreaensis]